TKKGRCDDIALRIVAVAERQAAELDHQHQDSAAGTRHRHLGRARQSDDAPGAAQTEQRQPARIAAHGEPLHDEGIETWRGNACRRYRDDPIDVVDAAAGLLEACTRDADGEVDGMIDIEPAALDPAVRLQIPFDRHAEVTGLDARIGEHRHEALDLRSGAVEGALAQAHDFLLPDQVRWRG